MSHHENLQVLNRPEAPPAIFRSPDENLYAFMGLKWGEDCKTVKSDANKAIKILEKSKNISSVQKTMYTNKLKNTKNVLGDDITRALWELDVLEKNKKDETLPTIQKFKDYNDEQLEKEKLNQRHLSDIKEEIAAFSNERHEMNEGKMPAKYHNFPSTVGDAEALAYEAPKTNINVQLLHHKLRAEEDHRLDIVTKVYHYQRKEIEALHKKGSMICTILHTIDYEIARIQKEF